MFISFIHKINHCGVDGINYKIIPNRNPRNSIIHRHKLMTKNGNILQIECGNCVSFKNVITMSRFDRYSFKKATIVLEKIHIFQTQNTHFVLQKILTVSTPK